MDFCRRGHVNLREVEVIVLDEADRMLSMGFSPDVRAIIRQTPKKEDRQTLLFSATFSEQILRLAEQWTFEPVHVEIESDELASATVDQRFYSVARADKYKVLNSVGGDSRIGNKYFNPGYSFGGPCFPRDTKALKLLVDKVNINSDILTATTKYNEEHIKFQVEQMLKENKDEYIIENVCYKEGSNIPIIEESAKLKIAYELVKNSKSVIIKDIPEIIEEVKKEYGNLFKYDN